ncbi:hypothetical protein O9992_30845 [Vibrio lentus]|nr:hypothetical protein [Vibrio lentus]
MSLPLSYGAVFKVDQLGRWNVSSRARYFYGTGWGEANDGDIGTLKVSGFINEI